MMSLGIANWDRRMWLLLGALALTIAALIGFHLIRDQHAVNALAVVDITGSMNTRDMGKPPGSETRLQAARRALVDLIQNVPCQSKLGLGVFTERISFLLFEPVEICNSYDGLENALSELDWRMAWQGDSYIAKGLYSAIDIAASLKSDVIFLTDGQEAPPLPFTGTPPFEGKPGDVKGLIVGIGGTEKSPIPKFDDDGRQVGVYGPSDVPQDNRIGAAPPGADKREGFNPRNAPFGALPESGDEHLTSVKTAHLQELAEKTGLNYVELQ
jgi:mxaL protein